MRRSCVNRCVRGEVHSFKIMEKPKHSTKSVVNDGIPRQEEIDICLNCDPNIKCNGNCDKVVAVRGGKHK